MGSFGTSSILSFYIFAESTHLLATVAKMNNPTKKSVFHISEFTGRFLSLHIFYPEIYEYNKNIDFEKCVTRLQI